MNDNEEAKKSKGGAIGAVIGTLVLAAACAVGGWIANDLWPKKEAEKPQMPQMVTTVAVKAVGEIRGARRGDAGGGPPAAG